MEARYMVSYFACNNSDPDVADACNCPPDAHLALMGYSPEGGGFKFTSSKKST